MTDTQTELQDVVEDGITFNKDGKITAVLDGKRIVMRRPKLFEYKALQQYVLDKAKEEAAKIDAATELSQAVPLLNDQDETFIGFLSEALSTLGIGPVDAIDWSNLDAWVASPDLCPKMLKHWREVPLAHG